MAWPGGPPVAGAASGSAAGGAGGPGRPADDGVDLGQRGGERGELVLGEVGEDDDAIVRVAGVRDRGEDALARVVDLQAGGGEFRGGDADDQDGSASGLRV